MRVDELAWPIKYFFVSSVWIELEPEKIVRSRFESQAVFERCLDLNLLAVRGHSVVVGLRNLMQYYVVFEFCDDLAYVTDETTIDREAAIGKSSVQALDSLEHESEAFSESLVLGHGCGLPRETALAWGL